MLTPGVSTIVSVAPEFRLDVYVVAFIDVDLMLTTVDEEPAETPIAERFALPLTADANPEAMLVSVSPDNTV